MEKRKFDVFVIGSGIAGQTVAVTCAEAGKKVAIADDRAFGGTCAIRGCDPKKVLLTATEVMEMYQRMKGIGIQGKAKINWKELQAFKSRFTDPVPLTTEEKLKNKNITLFHQSPKFIDHENLVVEGKRVRADTIVIATGLEPRPLTFSGASYLKLSDEFLSLKKLPKSVVFMGAGYIGMEFAHMAVRAGARVTVLEHGDGILKTFDPQLAQELKGYSEELGIRFVHRATPISIKKGTKKYTLTYEIDGKENSLKTHAIFHTAGRIPALAKLKLEKGGVAFTERGIRTNSFLQSVSNPNVYACGDVSDKNLPLTPLSGRQGYVVANNILQGNTKSLETPVIPSVVFTLPNLASVGYSEMEAQSRYKNVIVNFKVVPKWYNAKRINAPLYAYKILKNERTGKIIGAHILGPQAAETINIFTMAINHKMTGKQLKQTVFTYPSWGNDVKSMV